MSKDQERQNDQELRTSVLEYVIAGLGLALVLAALGFMGYRALADDNRPPEISLEVLRVTRSSGGYLVLLEARNSGDETAAELTVEGTVERPGQEPETSEVTFDFVPPDSVREGGLFFQADPEGALTLKLLGYREP
jgi:uncharacterized protein (TIGR02588 family)